MKGKIQLGIEAHKRELLEAHLEKLERMYLAAPGNDSHEPGVSISEGQADVVIPIGDELLHDAGSPAAIGFKAMDDAARLAVGSVVQDVVVSTAAFHISLTGPITSGELMARGRLVSVSDDVLLAETVLLDSNGVEIGAGNGTYVKSSVPLSAEIGYS